MKCQPPRTWDNVELMPWVRSPFVCALAATLLAFLWQATTVRYNYQGNWTALFCTGALFNSPPAALAFEHIYLFNNSGYDGQLYHYMAHDPFLTRGFQSSMDSPRFRYRRILMPLCAWLLAAGQDRFVDAGMFAVVLAAVFAGTWWVASIARSRHVHTMWSLAFLFVPAVTAALDRMTVDIGIVAVMAGVSYYARAQRWIPLLVLCAAAGLIRETGLLIPAALALWFVTRRDFASAAWAVASVVPTMGWYTWLNRRTPPIVTDLLSPIPFAGVVRRLLTPFPYNFTPVVNVAATILDYAAIIGIVIAVAYWFVHARHLWREPEGLIALAFVVLIAIVSSPAVWTEAYAFARGFSPLLLLTGLDGFRTRSLVAPLPIALTASRIGLQLGSQILVVARGLTGI